MDNLNINKLEDILEDPQEAEPSTMPVVTFVECPGLPYTTMLKVSNHDVLATIIRLDGNTDCRSFDVKFVGERVLEMVWEETNGVANAINILQDMVVEHRTDGTKVKK